MGTIAKGVNKISFTMLYGNYCYVIIENRSKKFSPCNIARISTHGENFMAIFTALSVVIWLSTGTLGIFATLVYVFTMSVVINDILSIAIIPTLSTSIVFCNLCYILL